MVSDDREPSGRPRSRGGSGSGAVCLEQTCHLISETRWDTFGKARIYCVFKTVKDYKVAIAVYSAIQDSVQR